MTKTKTGLVLLVTLLSAMGCSKLENKTIRGKIIGKEYNTYEDPDGGEYSKIDLIIESMGDTFHFSSYGIGNEFLPARAELYNQVFNVGDSVEVIGKVPKKQSHYLKRKGINGRDAFYQKAWKIHMKAQQHKMGK